MQFDKKKLVKWRWILSFETETAFDFRFFCHIFFYKWMKWWLNKLCKSKKKKLLKFSHVTADANRGQMLLTSKAFKTNVFNSLKLDKLSMAEAAFASSTYKRRKINVILVWKVDWILDRFKLCQSFNVAI